MTRRHAVERIAVCLSIASLVVVASCRRPLATAPIGGSFNALSKEDEAFLEDLQRRSFRYFDEQADPATGQVRDRARTDGSPHDENHRDVASIAATGFGLASLCIAAERGLTGARSATPD